MPWEEDGKAAPLPIGKQDTSHVAEEVLREQVSGDEFKLPEPAEMVRLRGRLDEIRDECSELYSELYPMYKPSGPPPKQPRYKRQDELRERIAELEREESGIMQYLRQVYDAMQGLGPTPTYVPTGPFSGSASGEISENQQPQAVVPGKAPPPATMGK